MFFTVFFCLCVSLALRTYDVPVLFSPKTAVTGKKIPKTQSKVHKTNDKVS